MERRLTQPGFGMAVVLVVMVVAAQVVLSMPLAVLDLVIQQVMHRPPPQLARHPLAIACINLGACGGAIAFGLYLNRLPWRYAFPFGRITAQQLAGVAITILGAGILLSEGDNLFRWLWPPPHWLQDLFKDLFGSEGHLLSRVFLMVIVAPVTEELLFRGIILRGLLSRHRPGVAVLLTALLFAAVHLNPWQFVSTLFLGIAFGWFYLRTGSVAICVVAHAIANSLCIVFTSLPLEIPGLTGTPDYTKVEFQPWWLDLTGMAVLLVGLQVFFKATPPQEEFEGPPPPALPSGNTGDVPCPAASSGPPPLPPMAD